MPLGCISFYSYIKPQLDLRQPHQRLVVYRSIPTSNRNIRAAFALDKLVVYRSIPTSNRNHTRLRKRTKQVVYRSIPTSNRNYWVLLIIRAALYIVLFLHQTATKTVE